MSPAELKEAWPFSGLVPEIVTDEPLLAEAAPDAPRQTGALPLPVLRADASASAPVLRVVATSLAPLAERLALSYRLIHGRADEVEPVPAPETALAAEPEALAERPPPALVAAYAQTGAIWPGGRGAKALALLDRMATGSIRRQSGPAKRTARFAPSWPQPEPEREGPVDPVLQRRVSMIGALGFGEVQLEEAGAEDAVAEAR